MIVEETKATKEMYCPLCFTRERNMRCEGKKCMWWKIENPEDNTGMYAVSWIAKEIKMLPVNLTFSR